MLRRMFSLMLLFALLFSLFFSISSVGRQQPFVCASSDERSRWISWASTAWRFFQPGVAVDVNTGLCGASLLEWWPYFTEWDLGTYILAVLDAEKIGILPVNGPWGSVDRLNRIMTFLQVRELAGGVPYVWHDARTGAPARSLGNGTTGVSDLGNLLVALHSVKVQHPELASTVDYIVHVRMNLTGLASNPSAWASNTASGVYMWYIANGFKFFGFDEYAPVQDALNCLGRLMVGPQVTTYNVTLPIAEFTSEPLLLAALHLPPNSNMSSLVFKGYLAQENRYRATGKYTAFSEGNTATSPTYVYEWIVQPDGQTWTVRPEAITPIVYIKVGFGFYALYQTQYALDLINYVSGFFTDFSRGYWDGVDEAGRVVNTIIDRTNGFVLAAARYFLRCSVGSLGRFPQPFLSETSVMNATFVIGDTEPHPPVGWRAYTADLMGSLGVAYTLGQLSSSGGLSAKLDTSICSWNSATQSVAVNWSKIGNSNVISVGGPLVNLFTYYYEQHGGLPFRLAWVGSVPVIRSNLTGSTYSFVLGVTDYAILSLYRDNGRFVLVGWGLTHRGTIALCQFLQYFNSQYSGLLSDRAMIIKWADQNGDAEVDLSDAISIVEVWS